MAQDPNQNPTWVSSAFAEALPGILATIPCTDPEYVIWWVGGAGQRLYSELAAPNGFGARVASGVVRTYGVEVEAADVANTAVDLLRHDFVIKGLTRASNPAGYLYRVLRSALCNQVGTYFRSDTFGPLGENFIAEDHAQITALTPIVEAVGITAELLRPYTPEPLRVNLDEAVFYFAERGHSRISHLYTHATRDPELLHLGYDRKQVLAVANAVLGARPRNGETSILAQVIIDRDFNPETSAAHSAALRKFARNLNPAFATADTERSA